MSSGSMAKGRNPAKVTHEWVMIATFAIGEQEVEQLAAARVDPSGEGRADVQLGQEKMTSLDGPGCRQCGLEWTVGYGVPCEGPMTAERMAREMAAQQILRPVDNGAGLALPPEKRLIIPGQPG